VVGLNFQKQIKINQILFNLAQIFLKKISGAEFSTAPKVLTRLWII
jgi:hypothetical protein